MDYSKQRSLWKLILMVTLAISVGKIAHSCWYGVAAFCVAALVTIYKVEEYDN